MVEDTARVALVAGAATPAGRRIALALAELDLTLVLTDVNAHHLEAVAQEVAASGATVVSRLLDVTRTSAWEALVREIEESVGRLRVLVNAAELDPGPRAGDLDADTWDVVAAINLGGVLKGVATAVPHLRRHGMGAHLVVTVPAPGAPAGPYVATRSGVGVLMAALADELADDGVRVTALAHDDDPRAALHAALGAAGSH